MQMTMEVHDKGQPKAKPQGLNAAAKKEADHPLAVHTFPRILMDGEELLLLKELGNLETTSTTAMEVEQKSCISLNPKRGKRKVNNRLMQSPQGQKEMMMRNSHLDLLLAENSKSKTGSHWVVDCESNKPPGDSANVDSLTSDSIFAINLVIFYDKSKYILFKELNPAKNKNKVL
uniref:Uncharacterized protein n=1 Tax=Romanomermis culicivorax TaxID=13658 RepID=A0A915IMU3_ROMCU